MQFIKQLRYQQKGHLGQYEDWWDLFQQEDGSFVVRHKWDHVRVGTLQADRGENISTASQSDIQKAREDPEAAARIQVRAD